MAGQSLRSRLIVRGIIAHFTGLIAASLWVSVQLDGFPLVPLAIEGVILGAFLATPWALVMFVLFWFRSQWLDRHPVKLCIVGPISVWFTAFVLVLSGRYFPPTYMEPVVVASLVASAAYYLMHELRRRRFDL